MMPFIGMLLLQQAVTKEFVFHTDKPAKSVAIAGTFNGWNKGATLLTKSADGRTWTVRLTLEPGKIQYKFVVDDDNWITDPENPKTLDDGNGHVNSLLLILPSDYTNPASPNDGIVTKSALLHRVEIPDVNYDRGHLTLSLRARPNDLKEVDVRVGAKSYPATEHPIDDLYARYTASIPWNGRDDLTYSFELNDGSKKFYYGPQGLTTKADSNAFALTAKTYKPFAPPEWTQHTVIYQIFPDRFANGDRTNDPKDVVAWDAKPTYSNKFGGDVAGVRQHLDYLRKLGITTVYFNPVFSSPSNHRYETSDYLKIDPAFGTNEEFASLTRELQSDGIRTILDGVFNHSATNFFAFKDILENQRNSRYLSWYTVRKFPVTVQENPPYVAWYNYPSMPKLSVLNPATRDYLLGVLTYWNQNAAISGWRLDTGSEVASDFWRAFRIRLKSLNPDNWIIGEEWGDASAWLKGDQWDSVMNYPFREAMLRFVGKTGDGKPSAMLTALMSNYNMYAPQVSRNLMNLLGSHDTARILTECGGDKDLAKMAAAIQFTWVGTPSIYYGDELGMEGDHDPMNRAGMQWGLATDSNDMLRYYRKLVAVRNANPVLQIGDPVPLLADDASGIAAFGRVLGPDSAVVVVNRSSRSRRVSIDLKNLPGSAAFTEALSGVHLAAIDHKVSLTLSARETAILVPSHAITTSIHDHPAMSRLVDRPTHAHHGSKRLS